MDGVVDGVVLFKIPGLEDLLIFFSFTGGILPGFVVGKDIKQRIVFRQRHWLMPF